MVGLWIGDFYENIKDKKIGAAVGISVGLSDGDFYEKIKIKNWSSSWDDLRTLRWKFLWKN